MKWKNCRARLLMKTTPLFYCISIFFFSSLALFSTITTKTAPCVDMSCAWSGKPDSYTQDKKLGMMTMEKMNAEEVSPMAASGQRRFLSGPGSSPPRCASKCGNCTPCKPVHVPVPPGTPVTAEYYPEAWRCKCGNKLYMP
ncbi:hypothetical protein NMG60_11034326 [Bertholletia excelsa]